MSATSGRYELLERIGQGGMAEVFKAKSRGVEGFEKIVVIKRILAELATSREFIDLFIHEAKLAVRLSHANVVQVFDLGRTSRDEPGHDVGDGAPDAYYMAMEYVNGFDLGTILARCRRQGRPVPFEMALYIAAEVAKGLDHAHRRRDEQNRPLSIVHLDVSPQNVLCSMEGEVKVTDFGIAKAQGAFEAKGLEDTRVRHLRGKYGYMSPEQAGGHEVDARSDLFSLGTVLYEMIAGVHPFSAPTPVETMRRVLACEYPPVALLRPDVPEDLVALLATAMARSPDDRFGDAGRMYEALVSLLYAQGLRFSARHLSEFLAPFRGPEDDGEEVVLDAEGPGQGRTPVLSRPRTSIPAAPVDPDEGPVLDLARSAVRGARREVTALVVEVPFERGTASNARPVALVATIVARYGGRILSRDPEQLAALFGLDEGDGRDTETATRCALAILRASRATRRPSAGLQTGRIHVDAEGQPTNDERLTQLLADARDLARAREGACAVGLAALRVIRQHFEFETLGGARSDGLSSTTTVLVRDASPSRGSLGKFVGRKAALRVVGDCLEAATRRRSRILTVRGGPGIGKSRLLVEAERRLRKGNYNVVWHGATCAPHDAEIPFAGIRCMLHVVSGVPEGASEVPGDVASQLRAFGLRDDEVRAVAIALGGRGAPPTNVQRSLVEGFSRIVHGLALDRPRVFAWDVAEGMDPESLAAVAAIVRRSPEVRALFAFAARPTFDPPFELAPESADASSRDLSSRDLDRPAGHTVLDLGPLDPQEAERLIGFRVGIEHVPPELQTFFEDRAAGHPQMIEELAKALEDARAVTVADGSIVSMRLVDADLSLPKTLRGLVASRMERLSAVERGVLQAASVLSEPIELSVLARMSGLDVSALERMAQALVERSLLTYVGPIELRFASPVVRDVVAFALTAEASREIHAAAARVLERDDRASEHAGRIAHHLYAAGFGGRAAPWFGMSGERALGQGSYDAAMRDFARALDLVDPATSDVGSVSAWFSGLARAVGFVRALPDAANICERIVSAIDLMVAEGSVAAVDRRVRVRIDAGRILGALDLPALATTQFGFAEALAAGDPTLTKAVLAAAVELAGRQGEVRRAADLLARLEALPGQGDRVERHQVAMSLARTKAAMGDAEGALVDFERARALLPEDPTAMCERDKLRGFIAYAARDYRVAVVHFDRALDAARELGLAGEVATNLHNVGDALLQLGDRARAYGALKQSLLLSEELGQDRLSNHNRMYLAFFDALAGDVEAEKLLIAGIAYAEAYEFTWDVLGARYLLARLLHERGAKEEALRAFDDVRLLAEQNGHVTLAEACLVAMDGGGIAVQAANPRLSSVPSRTS